MSNQLKVEYDSQPYFVVEDINAILKQNFNIEIVCLSEDNEETLRFEIKKMVHG